MRDLTAKNIIVTGASSGIGQKAALKLAYKNANLILIARRQDRLESLQRQCQALSSGTVEYVVLDISIAKHVQETIATIIEKYQHIDVLINAAGFGDFTTFVQTDYSLWNKMFKVNVLGTMLMTRYVASNMIEQQLGQIINLGSMGGKIATPKSAIYSATKAAVIAFSNSLRLELRPFNIQVTTINPGPVKTDFFKIADHTGGYVQSVGALMLDPDQLAQKIVQSIGRPIREINVPHLMQLGHIFYEIMPHVGDYVTQHIGNKK
ncbi:SDR family oxidoreductase [Lactobacillus bombi]|nr:SDR family oxidoreductase [Bombilactobacillus bombi]